MVVKIGDLIRLPFSITLADFVAERVWQCCEYGKLVQEAQEVPLGMSLLKLKKTNVLLI